MCIISPLVIRNYSLLHGVAELDTVRLQAVLKNTAHYRKAHALDNLQMCIDDLGLDVTDVARIVDKLQVQGCSWGEVQHHAKRAQEAKHELKVQEAQQEDDQP
jgi:hypothetical protein